VVLVACYIPYHFSLALLCLFLLTLILSLHCVAALVFLVFPRGDGVAGGFVGFWFCTEHFSAAPTRNDDAVGHCCLFGSSLSGGGGGVLVVFPFLVFYCIGLPSLVGSMD
jgi:hypothetical protein